MDLTEDGRRLKMMPVVDEYSRECLSIDVERSITAEDVISTLASLFRQRGEPAYIRSENGPEFIAKAIKVWLETSGVKTLYIEAGSPWENAYSETFISRFSDELLRREVFADLLEAKVLVEDYRCHYNHHQRAHSALGYLSPAEFVAAADLDGKEEDAGNPEELESALTLSEHLVQKTGSSENLVKRSRGISAQEARSFSLPRRARAGVRGRTYRARTSSASRA